MAGATVNTQTVTGTPRAASPWWRGRPTACRFSAATTTPAAGAADNLTITALDSFGNPATGYTGPKNLTFGGANTIGTFAPTVTNSTGTPVNFASSTAINFTNGTATVSTWLEHGVMKLYQAGTDLIAVTDGTITQRVRALGDRQRGRRQQVRLHHDGHGQPDGEHHRQRRPLRRPAPGPVRQPGHQRRRRGHAVPLDQLDRDSGHTPFFTTTSGGTTAGAVTIANGASTSANFYYSDTKAGTPTITLAGATVNTQTVSGTTTNGFTMVPGAPNKLVYNPEPPTTGTGGTTLDQLRRVGARTPMATS